MKLKSVGIVAAINVALFAVVLTFSAGVTPLAAQGDVTPTPTVKPPHWEYEGEAGPEKWGELSTDFATCSTGKSQSPINIDQPNVKNLTDITFDYKPSALTVVNNGHTIQVNYDAGSTITVDGTVYTLAQFHFHHPSEHTLGGESFPMELHLVHKDADGHLAVVGLLIREGKEDNAALAAVLNNMPAKEDKTTTKETVDAAEFLPEAYTFFAYSGSLTTPPCTEGVRWLVLSTPIELSTAQIKQFSDIFELNARPVQELNKRELTLDAYSN